MKLAVTAEYIESGDVTIVHVYVMDGSVARPGAVVTGSCSLRQNTIVRQTATFDRYSGNSDGPVKIAFNHPTIRSGNVYAEVTLQDGTTLDAVAPVQWVTEDKVPVAVQDMP